MCNLSDAIEQKGYNRGINHVFSQAFKRGFEQGFRQGFEQGISQVILEMLMAKQPIDMIVKFTKFSKEKIVEIGKENGVAVTV